MAEKRGEHKCFNCDTKFKYFFLKSSSLGGISTYTHSNDEVQSTFAFIEKGKGEVTSRCPRCGNHNKFIVDIN